MIRKPISCVMIAVSVGGEIHSRPDIPTHNPSKSIKHKNRLHDSFSPVLADAGNTQKRENEETTTKAGVQVRGKIHDVVWER